MAEKIDAGARKGPGRKPIKGSSPEMKSVKLSQEHWEAARRIGEGNMTRGIRRALDALSK